MSGAARFGAVAAGVVVLGMLAACGSASSSSSKSLPSSAGVGSSASVASLSGQSITVYSGQHAQTVAALAKNFQARTGVGVNVRANDEATLAGQILQEGSASPADVFYAENPPALTTLEEERLLAPVERSTLSAVPATVSDPAGKWVGVSARAAVFVANTSVPDARLPRSVFDLAGSYWKGKLGIAPSETDFSPIITKIIQAKGTDAAKAWLQTLKSESTVYDSNEALVAAVNKGEVAGGIIDHYYWYRLRDELGASNIHCRLAYFASGDTGNLVDVSGAAVLASSKHQAAAQAFLACLVSDPAQHIIATSKSYEYPLRAGLGSTKNLKPLSELGPLTSVGVLGDGKAALTLLQDVGLL